MSTADNLSTDLWRTLAKYGLDAYTDALIDLLDSFDAIPEEWTEDEDE